MFCLSSKFSKQAGFTLAEMMTVVGIVMVMTSVVLANLPDFRDRSSLDLVAQEVGLVIRQAQAYGSQTRASVFSSTQFPSYGVHFNLNETDGLTTPHSQTAFILFGDKNGDNHDTDTGAACGGDAECREVFNLQGGIIIDTVSLCPNSGSCTSFNHLNLVFTRPNPEAQFFSNTAGNLNQSGSYSYAKITLKLQKNNVTRDICVWTTGHIYSKTSCP